MTEVASCIPLKGTFMRRKAILAMGAAASTLLIASCGGSPVRTHAYIGVPAAHAAQQTCIDNVSALLLESYLVMRKGHYQGIPADSVLERYGYLSPTFQAFFELNSTLVGYVVAHGTLASPVSTILAATKIDGGVDIVCLGYVQQAAQSAQPVQPTAQAAPSPAASITYPTPTPEAIGPAGCPGSAALVAAWDAAPARAFHAQAIYPDLQVSGFDGITCWRGWVLAYPITSANGSALFSERGGLHMLSAAEMRQFSLRVCFSADAPRSWMNKAQGPCP